MALICHEFSKLSVFEHLNNNQRGKLILRVGILLVSGSIRIWKMRTAPGVSRRLREMPQNQRSGQGQGDYLSAFDE